MNKQTLKLRTMVPDDCIKLPGLLKRVWGIHSEESYWRWKYFKSPNKTIAFIVKKQNGEIVALSGFWLNKAKVGDTEYLTYQLTDVMADPSYRSNKAYFLIMEQLNDMIMNQKLIVFGFTNELSYKLFKKYFSDVMKFDKNNSVYSLVIKPGYLLKAPKIVKTSIDKITKAIVKTRLVSTATGNIIVEMADEFPSNISQLWNNVQKDYYWILKRNRDYLRWRFEKSPIGNYQIWLAKENDCLVGYMVTALAKRPNKIKGFIMDWLVPPKKAQIFNALLDKALTWFLQENTNVVETWFSGFEESSVKSLKYRLFIRGRRNKSFLLGNADHKVISMEKLSKSNIFFVTQGDSDFMPT